MVFWIFLNGPYTYICAYEEQGNEIDAGNTDTVQTFMAHDESYLSQGALLERNVS